MELTDRKRKILKAIIDGYIETGEPMGSSTLVRRYMSDFSSATVRNEMSDLEEMGYLEKTHISSGRVPSYQGYRFYVDMLMEKYRLTISEMNDLAMRLETKAKELNTLARRAGQTLSAITNYTSFVITPEAQRLRFKSLRLILIQENIALIVLVASGNVIKDCKVEYPRDINQEIADRLSGIITELFAMRTIEEIDFNASLFKEISRFWPQLVPTLSDFLKRALSGHDSEVFTDGASNIFRYREYHDMEKARALLDFVDNDDNIRDIVRYSDYSSMGCRTVIGKEIGCDVLEDCGIVIKPFASNEGVNGTIGIIGPARMDYSRVMSTLEYMADAMDNILTKFYE